MMGSYRTVPIHPHLLLLLEEMHEASGGEGLVCRGIASQRAMARGLRTWLRKAGVTRTALFEATTVNLNLRWHDLRAACGTWLAVDGRSSTEIRDVLGHTQVTMTEATCATRPRCAGGSSERPSRHSSFNRQ
jgi:integrase